MLSLVVMKHLAVETLVLFMEVTCGLHYGIVHINLQL